MHPFYQYVRDKNPDGLPYHDAVQLLLWVYSTVELLPDELRQLPLGRKELTAAFAKLAEDNLIIGYSSEVDHSPNQTSEWFWNSIIDDLLSKRVSLDRNFPRKISQYV